MLQNKFYHYGITALISLLVLFSSNDIIAQNNSNLSPYSRFGYGTLRKSLTAGTRAMGGASTGIRDHFITNPANPASYSAVDSVTFIMDIGLNAEASFLKEGKNLDQRWLGNLDYFTLLFPVGKKMGVSMGIMPWATTGYRFGSKVRMQGDQSKQSEQDENLFLRSYSGKGSYQKIYLGFSSAHIKNLAIGINGAFLFGRTELLRNVNYGHTTALQLHSKEQLILRGGSVDIGLQYSLKLDSVGARNIVFGTTFTPQMKLFSKHQSLTSNKSVADGVSKLVESSDSYSLPLSASFGFSYNVTDKYSIASDLTFTQWTGAKFEDLKASFRNRWEYALGYSWIPKSNSRNVLKRSRYSFGLNIANSYMKYPVQGIKEKKGFYELGASIGTNIPLVDYRSSINLGLEYKLLYPEFSSMVSEHYLGINIGITFNESWFRRQRVD